MGELKKCLRCRKPVDNTKFCQSCKSELLPFYEAAKDWQIAYDLESAQQRLKRFKHDPDIARLST